MKIYDYIMERRSHGRKLIALLIDPDKMSGQVDIWLEKEHKNPPDMIFVGGSLVCNDVCKVVGKIKQKTDIPVLLFPGNCSQVVGNVDAILFLSLISGRNSDYLIGQHVNSAMKIKNLGMETIPTGYMLIESGVRTSVEYVSGTMPIPSDKTDLAVATAVAGEMLGMKMIYLEAGSGAKNPVPAEIIEQVRKNTRVPLIVGGGLRNTIDVEKSFKSGADIVVLGTIFERDPVEFDKICASVK